MEGIKFNLITVLLILLIILVSIVLGTFIYKMSNDKPDVTTAIEETNNDKKRNTVKKSELAKNVTDNTSTENVSSLDSRLIEIVDTFNSSGTAQEMRSLGYTMSAMATGTGISLTSTSSDGIFLNLQFILDFDTNILSTEIPYIEKQPEETYSKLILSICVVDCVGRTKNYPKGALARALGEEEAEYYTIENEGVEIQRLSNNNIIVKVDLNSDFSFLNNEYEN